jgi:hypothetical protein
MSNKSQEGYRRCDLETEPNFIVIASPDVTSERSNL